MKIKVLWLCNTIVPQIQRQLGLSVGNSGGWLVETLDELSKSEKIEMAYCAPLKNQEGIVHIKYNNISFYGFDKKEWQPYKYDSSVEKKMHVILQDFKPDIVQIFGTEFPHALSMVKAYSRPERTIIHIQGLVSIYAKHYHAYLPESVIWKCSFRDLLRYDNIVLQAVKFSKRGHYETEAIKNVKHVLGRTSWDFACAKQINPDIVYHNCPENLRKEFRTNECWSIEDCEKYSIFMSQGNYPIKGLHLALEALHEVKKYIPEIKLYVAGGGVLEASSLKSKLRESYYEKYLRKLIKQWNLFDNIIFLGNLSAAEMKLRFLKAHVFIMPSAIENSPNSLCEAMSLGVPAIASYVGGVSDLLEHGKEGFLYPADEPYMLAYYIKKIMENEVIAKDISEKAKKRSNSRNDLSKNVETLIKVYEEVTNN